MQRLASSLFLFWFLISSSILISLSETAPSEEHVRVENALIKNPAPNHDDSTHTPSMLQLGAPLPPPMGFFPMNLFRDMLEGAFANVHSGPIVNTKVIEEKGICLITVDLNGLGDNSIVDISLDTNRYVTVEYNMSTSRSNEKRDDGNVTEDNRNGKSDANNAIFKLKDSDASEANVKSVQAVSQNYAGNSRLRRRALQESAETKADVYAEGGDNVASAFPFSSAFSFFPFPFSPIAEDSSSTSASRSTPFSSSIAVSSISSSNSFRLHDACDASGVPLAKATVIDDEHILKIKFPLAKHYEQDKNLLPSSSALPKSEATAVDNHTTQSDRDTETSTSDAGEGAARPMNELLKTKANLLDNAAKPPLALWHSSGVKEVEGNAGDENPHEAKFRKAQHMNSKKRYVIPMVRLEEF